MAIPAKRGYCLFFGDPHFKTFDGLESEFISPGDLDYWLVKTDKIWIQGKSRNGKGRHAAFPALVKGIAVGGPSMGQHTLTLTLPGPVATWDGKPVLRTLGSSFEDQDPEVRCIYDRGSKIKFGDHTSPKWKGTSLSGKPYNNRPTYLCKLPMGMEVIFVAVASYWGMGTVMSPQWPGIEGWCGNFNGNPDDDSAKHQLAMSLTVEPDLFERHKSSRNATGSLASETVLAHSLCPEPAEQSWAKVVEEYNTCGKRTQGVTECIKAACESKCPSLHAHAEKDCSASLELGLEDACVVDICLTADEHFSEGIELEEVLEVKSDEENKEWAKDREAEEQ